MSIKDLEKKTLSPRETLRFHLIAAVITPVTLDSPERESEGLIARDDALERNF